MDPLTIPFCKDLNMLEIAHAPPQDRAEIARFMQAAFPRAKWDRSGWDALLSSRWSGPDNSYAVTVRDKGKLVGVLGLVTATRPTRSGMAKMANITSWYVDSAYRGQGVGSQMLELVTADPDVTITNFSSAKRAVPVVERAGFSILDAERLVWQAGAGQPNFKAHRSPLTLGLALGDRDKQVIKDHAGLDLLPLTVETPDGLCTLILSIKQKHDAYVTYETMYVGNRPLFSKHAQAIALAVLPRHDAVLSVDSRFVEQGTQCDRREVFAVPRYYTPGRILAEDIDHLYSEIVLLGLKMY